MRGLDISEHRIWVTVSIEGRAPRAPQQVDFGTYMKLRQLAPGLHMVVTVLNGPEDVKRADRKNASAAYRAYAQELQTTGDLEEACAQYEDIRPRVIGSSSDLRWRGIDHRRWVVDSLHAHDSQHS